jgi:hypothetical protein
MPVLDAFSAACRRSVLSVVKRIAALSGLPAIKGRVGGADRSSDSILGCRPHPSLAFPASIVGRLNIDVEMPEMVSNQLVFQRTPCVVNIAVIAPVNPWKIY